MADNTVYPATLLTGGTDHALDGYDGGSLVEDDMAIVINDSNVYIYTLKTTGTESVPDRIVPDTTPGSFCWHLVDVIVNCIDTGIADTKIMRVDGSPNDDEYARFTANGLEGRTYAEVRTDLGLVIGTNVLAEQTIGIADNNLVEIDSATVADDEYARFTANGLESRSTAEVLSDIGAAASAHLHEGDTLVNDAITSDAATFQLTAVTFQLGPAGDPDAVKLDANKDLFITDGDLNVQDGGTTTFRVLQGGSVYVGTADTTPGLVRVYGGGNTEAGGAVNIYMPADQDAAGSDYYGIAVAATTNDLIIGTDGDPDMLSLQGVETIFELTGAGLKISHDTKVAACLYGGSTDPDGSTRLNYDGYFYATRVYNAVYNDFADYTDLAPGQQSLPGCCYVMTENGAKVSDKKCEQGVIGIASDLYGMAVGQRHDRKQVPISIGGYVLAFVDKQYKPGTPLTSGKKGILTEMSKRMKKLYPERLVATYMKKEPRRRWGDKPIRVNVWGRHWVKVA